MRSYVLGSCAAAAILLTSCTQDRPTSPSPSDLSGPSLAEAPAAAGEKIPGQYIVRLRDDVQDVAGVAVQIATTHGGALRHVYAHAIKGFSISIPDATAAAIARHPRVLYVEQNQVMRAITEQTGATWGIDRLDQRNLPLSTTYVYLATGSGVHAYIIDTGIHGTHTEFTGRVGAGTDRVNNDSDPADCNGHGTHVAGTVGGTTYGVAKLVTLHGVRVLDCGGSGTTDGVIAGVDWVTANRVLPAVANMSLGGGPSPSLDAAVTNSINSGVVYAIAAGNGYANACDGSPATTPDPALVTGATTSTDQEASFSDRGPCVDIWAPGVSITSAWYTSNTATNTISGTSMATPHVAGAAALYLHANPGWTPTQVFNQMKADATPDKVIPNNPFGLKPPFQPGQNKLLYTGLIPDPVPPIPPAAPSGLDATAVSASQINLVWTDNANNESGFKIERCTGAGCTNFAEIASVGENVTTYSNTGLAASTTYAYRVRAHNSAGSNVSNTDEATTFDPPPPAPPAAPSNLDAVSVSTSQINLTWIDNANNENGTKIQRCQGAGCSNFTDIASVGPDVTSYNDAGLPASTTFAYRVIAHNDQGESGPSNVDEATTQSPPPPIPAAVAKYSWRCGGSNNTSGRTCDFDGTPSTNEVSYAWNFGDPNSGSSNTSTASKPRHRFTSNGTWQVKLEVKNSAGEPHSVTCAVTTGVGKTGQCNMP